MYGLTAYNSILPSTALIPPSGQTHITRNPRPNREIAKCGGPFMFHHNPSEVPFPAVTEER